MIDRVLPSGRGLSLVALLLLNACGGGGGSAPPPSNGTPLPTALSLTLPAESELGQTPSFSSNAPAASGLHFRWDFGDGSSSSEAAPSHPYALPGEYTVTLTVSNEANQQVQASGSVAINRTAPLQGLACSADALHGWCMASPTPLSGRVLEPAFVDALNGWTADEFGGIARTRDGGRSWQAQYGGARFAALAVAAADAQTAWILGKDAAGKGVLLNTRDGGLHWQASTGPGAGFLSTRLFAFDGATLLASITTACGNSGCQVANHRSTDAGRSWTEIAPGPIAARTAKGVLWRYAFPAGGAHAFDSGSLLRSDDFGGSWSVALPLPPDKTVRFRLMGEDRIVVLDGRLDTGTASATARLSYSDDRGQHWSEWDPEGLPTRGDLAARTDFLSAEASGKVLLSWLGKTYVSTDAGRHWTLTAQAPAGSTPRASGTAPGWLLADATSRSAGLWLSTDWGASWTFLVDAIATENGPTMFFHYWATLGGLGDRTVMLFDTLWRVVRTEDAGQSWSNVLPREDWFNRYRFFDPGSQQVVMPVALWVLSPERWLKHDAYGKLHLLAGSPREDLRVLDFVNARWNGLRFADANTGWLLSESGALYRSVDAGGHWALARNPALGPIDGYGLGTGDSLWAISQGQVIASDDGGQQWRTLAPHPLGSGGVNPLLQRLSADQAVLVVNGRLALTRDAGQTWQERPTGLVGETIVAITAADANTLWLSGSKGAMLKSGDGGQTWARIGNLPGAANTWYGLAFSDARHGWLVGAGGRIVATRDGGASWTEQASGITTDLRSIQIVDSRTLWIVSAKGHVLTTGTGGW